MASNLVEMFNAALNWVTMILESPSARVVLFGVPIRGHFFVEGLLGVVIIILLTRKSYKPPKRPLTEQVLSQILSWYWFDRSHRIWFVVTSLMCGIVEMYWVFGVFYYSGNRWVVWWVGSWTSYTANYWRHEAWATSSWKVT